MVDAMTWIPLVLVVIGLFTCVRLVWRLIARLFQRKSREQRLIEELFQRNQQAALAYLSALLHETNAPGVRRSRLERLEFGRDGNDGAAHPLCDRQAQRQQTHDGAE